jgi:hypothetical protein
MESSFVHSFEQILAAGVPALSVNRATQVQYMNRSSACIALCQARMRCGSPRIQPPLRLRLIQRKLHRRRVLTLPLRRIQEVRMLEGKVSLVMGAASLIGRAIAR